MKYRFGILCACLLFCPWSVQAVDFPGGQQATAPTSFLSAQTFPTTFSDLGFVERMDVLRAGYEPWESEYDDNGKCLSNCAYAGITIQDDLDAVRRNTDMARAALNQYQPVLPPIQTQAESGVVVSVSRCTPFNSSIPANQSIPRGGPLMGNARITSQYGERIHPVTKKRQVHKGIDFSAPIGTDVYTPANGVVESSWTDKTCGNGLRIKHSDGFASIYCHLNDSVVNAGDSVAAGCVVAKTGDTGRSTGPHLHYGLYYNGQIINPTEYIKH